MKTVEELEARLEVAMREMAFRTRERDELRAIIGAGGLTYSEGETSLRARIAELAQAAESAMRERDMSLAAWEAAGMQGRTAQSAMLELARQLDESRETIVALTTAKAEADLEIAILTTALDERDELLVRVASQDAELRATREAYNEARAEVRRFRDWYRNAFGGPSKRETPWDDPCACEECESLRRLKDERPVHPSNLTDVVSLLEDERDELLVRVANQDAELRATREAYIEAKWTNAYRRGAEAMREACASAMRPIMRSMISRTEAAQTIRALPIPEEP